jgi:hypothetical protein
MKKHHFALVCLVAVAVGCSDSAAPTKAPPITGKTKDWKTMSKEEKIALIKTQPMPESARQSQIDRINQGLD